MKKKVMVALLLLVGSYVAWAGCRPGNIHVNDMDWCCRPVGDGSQWSCTDGHTWFLI